MAEQVADVGEWFCRIMCQCGWHRKDEHRQAQLLDWHDPLHQRQCTRRIHGGFGRPFPGGPWGHRRKMRAYPRLQGIEWFPTQHCQSHVASTVILDKELQQILAHRVVVAICQGRGATHGKATIRKSRLQGLATSGPDPAPVTLQLGGILRVDHCPFAVNKLGVQQRCRKKLRKPVQRRFKVIGRDIEIVVGVAWRGISVVTTTMTADKGLVLARLGITCSAEK